MPQQAQRTLKILGSQFYEKHVVGATGTQKLYAISFNCVKTGIVSVLQQTLFMLPWSVAVLQQTLFMLHWPVTVLHQTLLCHLGLWRCCTWLNLCYIIPWPVTVLQQTQYMLPWTVTVLQQTLFMLSWPVAVLQQTSFSPYKGILAAGRGDADKKAPIATRNNKQRRNWLILVGIICWSLITPPPPKTTYTCCSCVIILYDEFYNGYYLV